ncbi:MAG TPA: hypothetical protein VGT24_05230 [Candidatus Acidoferrales bacterium]|nr:hypothetical protein [Candidatus Acidoferrales bacterium]
MNILLLEILAIWALVAVIAAFGLGAVIGRGERIRKDEFLCFVFASLEALHASRG